MTLLIAVGIDANDETLLVAWALVPIESEPWWTWFLKHFNQAFHADIDGNVFMSDREKGLPTALKKAMPEVTQAYCCQHIADNVQHCFGLKCRPLFWVCAWAKSKDQFQDALKALIVTAPFWTVTVDMALDALRTHTGTQTWH
jgi:transposase-like protein